MIRHMRHGSPPRLMALQSILRPNRRESLPAPSAGNRITPAFQPGGHMAHRRASPKVEGKSGRRKLAQAASASRSYDGENDFPVDDLPPDDLPVRGGTPHR